MMLKLAGATAATVLTLACFQEKHKVEKRKDKVRDYYWKPEFRVLLLAFQIFNVGLLGWFYFDKNSACHQPWTGSEVVALIASLAGSGLRLWAMHTLGHLFTFEVAIRPQHTLIGHGPYRLVRHPSYSGLIVGLAGLLWFLGGYQFVFRSWQFWVAALPSSLIVYGRVTNEEEMMAAHFKSKWTEYCRTRWRIFPLLW